MTCANDSRRIRRLGEGVAGFDEKDRVARGARERSGNCRRNGERRETCKPGRSNDFPEKLETSCRGRAARFPLLIVSFERRVSFRATFWKKFRYKFRIPPLEDRYC